jgi:hypothetical protein
MMDWGYAIGQGLAGAAASGANSIDTQLKANAAADAEQRAADLKLDTATRMMAITEAMKNRAAERFSSVVKDQMGKEVPATPEAVSATGITHESGADALGERTYDGETAPATGLKLGGPELSRVMKRAQETIDNPRATDAQREDARALMEQIGKQAESQKDINEEEAKGKTRKPTMDEAQEAALNETLQNDAPAFIAGTGMLNAANKDENERKRLESRERIAKAETERKERADNLRYDAIMQRIDAKEAAGANGKGGNATALRQNVDLLKELGYTADKIEKFIFDKKEIPVEDIAAKILSSDKYGEMTPEQATEKALGIKRAAAAASGSPPAPAGAPSGSKPLKYDPTTGTFK